MAFRYVDLGMSRMFCEYCCNNSSDIASYLVLSPGDATTDMVWTVGVSSQEKKTVNTSFGDSPLKDLWSCVWSIEQRTSSAITTPVFRSVVRLTNTESQATSMGGLISYLDMDFLVHETLMLSSHCQNIAGICTGTYPQ